MTRKNTYDTGRDDVHHLLQTMDAATAASFTRTQQKALATALEQQWRGKHGIDFRPVVKIPLLPVSFYLVLLAGKNRRELSLREQLIAARTLITLIVAAILLLSIAGLAVLYLIKSALGIDLFENYHLGLWFWFQDKVLEPLGW